MTSKFYYGILLIVSSFCFIPGCAENQTKNVTTFPMADKGQSFANEEDKDLLIRAKEICEDVSLREKYGRVGSVVLEDDVQIFCAQ